MGQVVRGEDGEGGRGHHLGQRRVVVDVGPRGSDLRRGLEVDQGEQDEDKEERNSGVLSPDLVKL